MILDYARGTDTNVASYLSWNTHLGNGIIVVPPVFQLHVYKTSAHLDPYSEDGDNTDPIFDYPHHYFTPGVFRDTPLFLKNDDSVTFTAISIVPFDKSGADETAWVKLATVQSGLDAASGGAALSVGTLAPGASFPFWERVTVDAGADEGDKRDVVLSICALS